MEDVNWLDEINYYFYCGDGDITMRLNEKGWKTIPLNECYAAHLVHLPVKKKKIPKWNQIDMDTFNKLYPYKRIGDAIKKANINIKIDVEKCKREKYVINSNKKYYKKIKKAQKAIYYKNAVNSLFIEQDIIKGAGLFNNEV